MAKIDTMPSLQIISGYKGLLDFYVHKGQPCVRRWPRKPTGPRSPAVQATASQFGYFATQLSATPDNIRERATELAVGTAWTWRDLRYRAIYGNLIA